MFISIFYLTFTSKPSKQSSLLSTLLIKALIINLFEISIIAYNLLSKKKDYDAFITILDKINSLISDYYTLNQAASVTIREIDYSTNKRLIDYPLEYFSYYVLF